jgi:hypothetical protein
VNLRYQLLDEAGLAVVGRKFRRTSQCFVGAEALTTTAESLISALLINWPPVHDSTVTRVLLTLKPGLVRKSARVAHPRTPRLNIDLGASLPFAKGILGNKSRAQVFSLYRTAAKAGFLRREARRNTPPK